MRYIFLLVGFLIVFFVFGDHGWGFYISGAIVYLIFKAMDDAPRNNKNLSITSSSSSPPENPVSASSNVDSVIHRKVLDEQAAEGPAPEPIAQTTDDAFEKQLVVTRAEEETGSDFFKTFLIFAGGIIAFPVVLMVVGMLVHSYQSEKPEVTPPKDISTQNKPYAPSSAVWDRPSCELSHFPRMSTASWVGNLSKTKDGRLRLASAHMYCSRQWDDPFIALAAKRIEQEGLLLTQLLPKPPTEDLDKARAQMILMGLNPEEFPELLDPSKHYSLWPEPVSNFLKVFDSGPFFVAPAKINKLREGRPGYPKRDRIAAVLREIDFDRLATISNPLPQIYTVSDANPAVHLVTDVGLRSSLRQVIVEAFMNIYNPDIIRVKDHMKAIGFEFRPESDTNLMAGFIASSESMFLKVAESQRRSFLATYPADAHYKLPNLEIVLLSDFSNVYPAPRLIDRNGSYDRETSRIFVQAARTNSLPRQAGKEDLVDILGQLMPASLDHEIYHYLFFRPSAAASGFVMEGEATANGEYTHQQYLEGILASANRRSRILNDIWNKPVNEITDADWSEYRTVAGELIKNAPLTRVQCNSMDLVFSENVRQGRHMGLQRLLTYSPDAFQTQPDVKLLYAQAWAIYHIDLTQQRGWAQAIDAFAHKINGNQALSEEEEGTLLQIEKDTIEWIRKSELKRSTICPQ